MTLRFPVLLAAVVVAVGTISGAASAATQTCLTTHVTYGLGLSAKAFHSENPSTIYGDNLPSDPLDGVAYYEIKGKTNAGCVTSYVLYERTRPVQGGADLLFLFGGTFEPPDARQVASKKSCWAWKSATLQKHFGKAFAVAVLLYPQVGQALGAAHVSLSSTDDC